MKIGFISDTHGYLDPQIAAAFHGVEHILHAGDIGNSSIITQLEDIAPVTAVLGNNDAGLEFGETEVVMLGEQKFLIHHIVSVHSPHDALARRLEREAPDVVVFGHSHRTHLEQVGPVTFLNPGYAGKPRFSLPRTVAVGHCHDGTLRVQFVPLAN